MCKNNQGHRRKKKSLKLHENPDPSTLAPLASNIKKKSYQKASHSPYTILKTQQVFSKSFMLKIKIRCQLKIVQKYQRALKRKEISKIAWKSGTIHPGLALLASNLKKNFLRRQAKKKGKKKIFQVIYGEDKNKMWNENSQEH